MGVLSTLPHFVPLIMKKKVQRSEKNKLLTELKSMKQQNTYPAVALTEGSGDDFPQRCKHVTVQYDDAHHEEKYNRFLAFFGRTWTYIR